MHMNSQPFLRRVNGSGESPRVHAKSTYSQTSPRGAGPGRGETWVLWVFHKRCVSGNLHRTSPTGRTFACTVRTCAAAGSVPLEVPLTTQRPTERTAAFAGIQLVGWVPLHAISASAREATMHRSSFDQRGKRLLSREHLRQSQPASPRRAPQCGSGCHRAARCRR